MAAQLAEEAAKHRRLVREVRIVTTGFEEVAVAAEGYGGCLVAAAGRCDLAEPIVNRCVASELAQAVALLLHDRGCLVVAREHGEQPRPTEKWPGVGAVWQESVKRVQRFIRGSRAVDECVADID